MTQTYEQKADDLASRAKIVLLESEVTEVLNKIQFLNIPFVALDFETTAFDPALGRVRLTCIYHPQLGVPYVFDHYFCGPFNKLAGQIARACSWVVFNAKFETRWFDHALPPVVDIIDVDFVRKAKMGGGAWSLSRMCKTDLGIDLIKDEQRSDWTRKDLTVSQYTYAAKDAVVTWMLFDKWQHELPRGADKSAPLGFYAMNECVRATIECEESGMELNIPYHEQNIKRWQMKQDVALRRLRKITPESAIKNVNSTKQVHDYLVKALPRGIKAIWPRTEKKDEFAQDAKTLKAIAKRVTYPLSRWIVALNRYKYYDKYLSTYGDTLVTKQRLSGRVQYRLNIAQAATARYSSSNINIQNIPSAAYVRRAFLPLTGYEEFVTADYSGIEIRVLAAISGDDKLMYDAVYGNLHASMAAEANHIPEAEFMERLALKEPSFTAMRRQAKPGTFRITYGAGVAAVADSLNSTLDYAENFVKRWANRYPVAYNYRNIIFDQMNNTGFIPLHDGRTIYVPKLDRTIPIAANYGVQGAAATVMMRAMYHWVEMRNKKCTPKEIRLAASVHDELVTMTRKAKYRKPAYDLLKASMDQGWLDVFPGTTTDNLIEIGHGPTWGDCK